MISRVLYRPFEDGDFDSVAQILKQAWHQDTADDAYNDLETASDLAYSLSISTFSQVALIDGVPSGIILARSDNDTAPDAERWSQMEQDIIGRMRTVNERACENRLSFIKSEVRVNNRLLEQSGFTSGNEVTLLAVAASARGLGIGGVLFDAAASYLASTGATHLHLYTDSDCTWKFYERRGLKRAATHRASHRERKLLAREMYLYGLDLSA